MSGCSLQPRLEAEPLLAHFAASGPQVGDFLPSVQVFNLDGGGVDLSALVRGRPVVLQLGSHSCPVYRYRRFGMDKLVEEFGDRVDFVLLYSLEAHPVGGPSPYTDEEWNPGVNRMVRVRLPQTEEFEPRRQRAAWSVERLDLQRRVLVDGPSDLAWAALGRAPAPLYVVGLDGRILARQMWAYPPGLREILENRLGYERE